MQNFEIAAFYKFVGLTDTVRFQSNIKQFCVRHAILGTILLAQEGINGTVAGKSESIHLFLDFLRSHLPLADLEAKFSECEFMPFDKIKVRLKKEIVTLGIPGIQPAQKTGISVSPETWNELLQTPDVLVIDTRNTYEVELGTFSGAVNPNTEFFRDFPAYVKKELDPNKHKKIAMCCTGGIRCEKASSYLLEQGFENVYQLEGGILKYLEKVEPEKSLWMGECFIFDNRITIEKETIKAS